MSELAGLNLAAIAALASHKSNSPDLYRSTSGGAQQYAVTHPASHSYPTTKPNSHYPPMAQYNNQAPAARMTVSPSPSPPEPHERLGTASNCVKPTCPPMYIFEKVRPSGSDALPRARHSAPVMPPPRRSVPSGPAPSLSPNMSPRSEPPPASVSEVPPMKRMGEPSSHENSPRSASGATSRSANLGDEPAVNSHEEEAAASNVAPDRDDAVMADADSDVSMASQPKRKEPSVGSDRGDSVKEGSSNVTPTESYDPHAPFIRPRPQQPTPWGLPGEGVIRPRHPDDSVYTPGNSKIEIPLGYWRDSTVPDPKNRHAILGFIDKVERLRTRVVPLSRLGAPLPQDEFHFPSGTGSSWVTFERVVFEDHLVGLDHDEIKEYVKIRTESARYPETPEEAEVNVVAAVAEAKRRAALLSHESHSQGPMPIAYGAEFPGSPTEGGSRNDKRRRVSQHGSTPVSESGSTPRSGNGGHKQTASVQVANAIQRSSIDLLPGTRPAKILVGYWRGSSEERVEDKHAVLGILGANDMFRVKVTRHTRDGRHVLGNFPAGAGALWINYDEVEFEAHIRHLSRPEVKEYVRVRQRQLDEGEPLSERRNNEIAAVHEAQARVIKAGGASQSTLTQAAKAGAANNYSSTPQASRDPDGLGAERSGPVHYDPSPHSGAQRHESSGQNMPRSSRPSLTALDETAALAAAALAAASGNRPHDGLPESSGVSSANAERVERTSTLARREISRLESMQNDRAAGFFTSAGSAGAHGAPQQDQGGLLPKPFQQAFMEDMGRLNKVWEQRRTQSGDDAGSGGPGSSSTAGPGEDVGMGDYIVSKGIKYERKQTGPFQGKLVSPGTILSIDGEDYVEYRVLTKPTFF